MKKKHRSPLKPEWKFSSTEQYLTAFDNLTGGK